MLYQGWNDYELLYLIKEGSEKALNLMYLKYEKFIIYKARSCGFKAFDLEDCIQEGLLILTSAIKNYSVEYNKTFCKYFEIILLRHLWRLKSKEKIQYVSYEFDNIRSDYYLKEIIFEGKSVLNKEQAYIWEEIYYYHTPIEIVAQKLNLKKTQIYYELKKIREIIMEEFDLSRKKM